MESTHLFPPKKENKAFIFKNMPENEIKSLLKKSAEESNDSFAWLIKETAQEGVISIQFANLQNMLKGKFNVFDSIEFIHTNQGWEMLKPILTTDIENLTSENLQEDLAELILNIQTYLNNVLNTIEEARDLLKELENSRTQEAKQQSVKLQAILTNIGDFPENAFSPANRILPNKNQEAKVSLDLKLETPLKKPVLAEDSEKIDLEKLKKNLEDLKKILCTPGTQDLMENPVLLIKKNPKDKNLIEGLTYDRKFLEAKGYRGVKDSAGNYSGSFVPNLILKELIEAVKSKNLEKIEAIILDTITLEHINEAVLTKSGNSHSRESLLNWWKKSKKIEDPKSHALLKEDEFWPNHTLNYFIKAYENYTQAKEMGPKEEIGKEKNSKFKR